MFNARNEMSLCFVLVGAVALAGCSDDGHPNAPTFGGNETGETDDAEDERGDDGDDDDDDDDDDGETGGGSSAGDGDGDEDGGDGDDPSDEPVGEGELPDNAYCAPVAKWVPDWLVNELDVINRVNEVRAIGADCGEEGVFGPAKALKWDAALMCAARSHASDMALNDYFGHEDEAGHGVDWRLEQAGYQGSAWAQSLGGGFVKAESLVKAWLGADKHCANLLNPDFEHVGAGYAYGPNTEVGHYWVLTIGG
jgi:hypothetical protein